MLILYKSFAKSEFFLAFFRAALFSGKSVLADWLPRTVGRRANRLPNFKCLIHVFHFTLNCGAWLKLLLCTGSVPSLQIFMALLSHINRQIKLLGPV